MTIREAALEVLKANVKLTVAAGRFLGQCVASNGSLTDPQLRWLNQLRAKVSLPALAKNEDD